MEYTVGEEARFLATDTSGFLKIATDRGIYSHYGSTSEFKRADGSPRVWLGPDWLGTAEGRLHRLSDPEKTSFQITDSTAISCLLEFENRLFIGTEGEGLFALEPKGQIKSITLSDPFIYDLAIWKDKIYIATDRGIEIYDPRKNKVEGKLSSSITTHLCLWNDQLVAAVYGKGAVALAGGRSAEKPIIQEQVKKLLAAGERLYALTEVGVFEIDKSGRSALLFANESVIDMAFLSEKGLALLDGNGDLVFLDLRFCVFYESNGAPITALTGNETSLFVAESGSVTAISINNNQGVRKIPLPGSPDIVNLVATEEHLFAGSFDQGLFILDPHTGELRRITDQEGLLDNSVLGMACANDTLWFSTLSGLAYLPFGGRPEYFKDMSSTYIYDLHFSEEILWIGTDGNGLLKKEGSRISSASAELSEATVYRISHDGAGNLRCITKEQGIYTLNAGEFNRMDLVVDNDGYTAFGCGPANTTILIDEGRLVLQKDGKTAIYDEQSGFEKLSDAYLNTFSAPIGESVYFASGTKVYRYRPDTELSEIPVALIEATSDFKPISFESPEVDHDGNNLIFKLAAPKYRNPQDVEFRYRLKGLEEEFRKTKNPDLIYPNLPFGNYVLEAQAGHYGIYQGEPIALISFTILRPFYLKPWFITTVILALISLIYLIVKVREANINRLRFAEKRLIESELAVLRTQVNPHFLFNSFNTLMGLIEGESKAGAEYLEKLSDFYRRILADDKSQVIAVREELEILKEYLFLQKQRFRDAFTMEIKIDPSLLDTPIPTLTLQILAENALKHNVATASKPLDLRLFSENGQIVFCNPIYAKRKPAEGTGLGLENIAARYDAIFNAEVKVEKSETEFCVKLPILNSSEHGFTHF